MSEEILKEYPDFNIDFLKEYFLNGNLIDARKGGLVLGKSHPEKGQKHLNNIHILVINPKVISFLLDLQEINLEGILGYWGSIEGGEYILSSDAFQKYRSLFNKINSDSTPIDPLNQISITEYTRIINAFGEGDKYLLVNPVFAVVRKEATAKNLEELELMNALVR